MECGSEERPSSVARERARSRTLQTCAASWEASFPFIAFSTNASAFLIVSFFSILSLVTTPATAHLAREIYDLLLSSQNNNLHPSPWNIQNCQLSQLNPTQLNFDPCLSKSNQKLDQKLVSNYTKTITKKYFVMKLK